MTPEWSACLRELLAGVAHAANNRVGALVALAETLEPGEPLDAALVASVRGEVGRLEAVLGALRVLAADDDAVQAVHVADEVAAAVALAALHPAVRGARVAVSRAASPVAVQAAPARVRQAVVLAVVAAAPFARAEVGWGVRDGVAVIHCAADDGAAVPVLGLPVVRPT